MNKSVKEFPFVLFLLSFLVLTVQIVLSAFLRVYLKLPFLAITFAFLGLSSAGVYTFWKYGKSSSEDMLKRIPSYINTFGILLFFYFTVIAIVLLSYQSSNLMEATLNYKESGQILVDRSVLGLIIQAWVTGIYFSVCFFILGIAISLIYKVYSSQSSRYYYFDLCGAAAGCVLGSIFMNHFDLYPIALFLSLICFVAAVYLKNKFEYPRFSKISSVIFMVLCLLIMMFYSKGNVFSNRSAKFKELWSDWNAYSRVSLIEENLKDGLNYKFLIDNGSGIAHLDPFNPQNPYEHKLFDQFTPTSLGFLIGHPSDILILMTGAGTDMIEAYNYSGSQADITGIELNPLIVDKAVSLPEFHLKEFFALDNVHMIVTEGRSFLETTKKTFDTVIFSWSGSPINNYLGINANSAQFLYTKEAFKRVLEVLKPDGTIVIVNGNKLRTIAVFREAFAELGINDISEHFTLVADRKLLNNDVVYKEMLTPFDNAYLLVKKSRFTERDMETLNQNIDKMNFVALYAPNNNKANITPYYQDIINEIVHSGDFPAVLKKLSLKLNLNLTMMTDDKPFISNHFYFYSLFDLKFWKFFKNNMSSLYNKHYTYHLFMMSFVLSIIVFVIAAIAVVFRISRKDIVLSNDLPFFIYFSVIGFAFMLVEISLLNQFVLYLANPIYALSVILAGLLFSLGVGSYLSDSVLKRMNLTVKSNIIICTVLLVVSYFSVPYLVQKTLGMPLAFKFGFVFLYILPLGIFLGTLFPQGLKKLGLYNNRLVPLAWGLNGYMSVIGSAVSIFLSTIVGFKCFLLIAAGMYFTLLFFPFDRVRKT